jgi:hypothetical protein
MTGTLPPETGAVTIAVVTAKLGPGGGDDGGGGHGRGKGGPQLRQER